MKTYYFRFAVWDFIICRPCRTVSLHLSCELVADMMLNTESGACE